MLFLQYLFAFIDKLIHVMYNGNKETSTTSEIPKVENNPGPTNDVPEEPPEKTPAEKVE